MPTMRTGAIAPPTLPGCPVLGPNAAGHQGAGGRSAGCTDGLQAGGHPVQQSANVTPGVLFRYPEAREELQGGQIVDFLVQSNTCCTFVYGRK